MVSKEFRRQTFLVSTFGVLAFIVLTILAVTWAMGLSFNRETRAFEQTSVIAIDTKLADVTVLLNNKKVSTKAPIQLRGLIAGRYEVSINKKGFYPYKKVINLGLGEARTIDEVPLIATQPLVTTLDPTARFLTPVKLSASLTLDNGELYDGTTFITRFSTDPYQVHSLESGYIYQSGSSFYYLFPDTNQDVLIYKAVTDQYVPINVISASWAIIVNENGVKKLVNLTIPTESVAAN